MPLSRQQALDHFHSPDLIGLGMEADAVRRRMHPEGVVTYIIDRIFAHVRGGKGSAQVGSPQP